MRKKRFEQALRECAALLEATGGDVEAVIGRYPEHRERLRSHLQVWLALGRVEQEPAPAQGASAGRQRLLAAVSGSRLSTETGWRRAQAALAGGFGMRMIAPFVAGLAVALGAVFLAGAFDSDSGSRASAIPVNDCIIALDFNGDGMLDVNDVIAFRTAIEQQDLAFDFNGDTVVDVFDVVPVVSQVVECLRSLQPPPPPAP